MVALRRYSRVAATQRLLDEMRFVLADVSLLPLTALPWDKVWIDRTNQRWAGLFALAKLLLKRDWQTTRHDTLSRDGFTLLFPMNELFEAAVSALLRRALAGQGIEVVEQGGLRHCLGDWEQDRICKGTVFQTRPDIILKRRGSVWAIIDTKWKALPSDPLDRKSGVSQADVYQLMAYARLYECQNLMLLYPAKPGQRSGELRRFGIAGTNELLSVGSIDVAMDTVSIKNALLDLVGKVFISSRVSKLGQSVAH